MADEIKKLLESEVLSPETKQEIAEVWEQLKGDLKESVTAEIRQEFSAKYERDRENLIEAMDKMVQDALAVKMQEINEQEDSIAKEKVENELRVRNHLKHLDQLAEKVMNREIKELVEDRKVIATKLEETENFIVKQLGHALQDVENERSKLIQERVELKAKAKNELAEAKTALVENMSIFVDEHVSKVLEEELLALKEEITEARQNEFGRKLFEVFSAEFDAAFFRKSEKVRELTDAIAEREKRLEEMAQVLANKEQNLNEVKIKVQTQQQVIERQQKLTSLLQPLTGDRRAAMEHLLNKEPTNKLQESFDRYLPYVLQDERPARNNHNLYESHEGSGLKEVTGNRKELEPKVSNALDVASDFTKSLKKLDIASKSRTIVR